jgi:hypothetical protein
MHDRILPSSCCRCHVFPPTPAHHDASPLLILQAADIEHVVRGAVVFGPSDAAERRQGPEVPDLLVAAVWSIGAVISSLQRTKHRVRNITELTD